MRTFLLSFLMTISLATFGQNNPTSHWIEHLNFDNQWDTFYLKLEIDTTDTNNIWQIGQPQKTVFNQSNFVTTNGLVTDTINPYPINDTSSFTITYFAYNCLFLFGNYYCDTDSLNDYGIVEVSLDNGQTWIDILNDSTLTLFNTPTLTGQTNGWQYFDLDFSQLNNSFYDDTVKVKFTFISDSTDTQQDGILFDDLGVCILLPTQNLYQLNDLKVFPNPTNNLLNFQFTEPIKNAEIRIYSSIGQLILNQNVNDMNMQFDVSKYSEGIYFYGIYVEGEVVKQGQILIEN